MELKQKKIIMKQINKTSWQILSESGILLVDDIKLGLIAEAEDYVKRYISSFDTWTYDILPMEDL